MFGTRFNMTDHGMERAVLLADTAFFFNDNTRVELEHVNATFYTATGAKDATLTSRHGTYHTQTGVMSARDERPRSIPRMDGSFALGCCSTIRVVTKLRAIVRLC